MSFKYLVYIVLFLFNVNTNCFSQTNTNKNKNEDSEIDSAVIIPTDINNSLDNMLQSWVVRRSSVVDCNPSDEIVQVSDSVFKIRMAKMPYLMEMPYNPIVSTYIDLYTVKKRSQVSYMLGMSQYYFPIFEQILVANNLPLELKYLSIIESALNTTIVSHMGAAGLWQLMIATGRMYGLEINSLVDERLSPVKATNAAARFMKDLYSMYGDWNLVIAAYNCGPGNVNKAIRRSGGKRDYWAIYPYLPRETRGYVPIFIAANYVFNYAPEHNLCAATVNMPAITDTVMVHNRIHLEQVAEVLNLPIEQVRLLNAQYKKDIIPGDIKPYALNLPLNYANQFISKLDEVLAYKYDELIDNRRSEIEIVQAPVVTSPGGSRRAISHKVKSGQTLSDIAAKYGVSLTKLKKWNHIRGSHIKVGQRLKVLK